MGDAQLDALLDQRDTIRIQINLAENGGEGSVEPLTKDLRRLETLITRYRKQMKVVID